MDGAARNRRFAAVERAYVPTRLSEDTLRSVYELVSPTCRGVQEVSESSGVDGSGSEPPLLVLTGGLHA